MPGEQMPFGGSATCDTRGVALALSVLLHMGALAALVAATLRMPTEIDRTATVTLVSETPMPPEPPPAPSVTLSVPEPHVPLPTLTVADSAPSLEDSPVVGTAEPVIAPVVRSDDRLRPIDAADLSCVRRIAPAYPPQSRRMREEGSVDVLLELDVNGYVANARVARSSGHPRLDAAALEAVRQWHCEPARRGGRIVGAVALQSFEFTLQRR